ncbi:hypothetical protein B5F77_12945 [Parabacteroides sp. An277]|uniref:tetratricopeptide repeat protein n=1 Tax=Parabacteroides sp. An277 TaxID=1965619 RepID=UPI000B3A4B57|nr:tetratricopeptide repeat protein [Parabacteroides sp. An277]OUO50340.1 hypothetical protein B5F77_12945 [Parabacteroides sp. An277]
MATKEKETVEVEELVSRSELFIEKYSTKILVGIVAIIVIAGGIFAYRNLYLAPKQLEASAAMFKGEQYFAKDSFQLALNGNGADYAGFEAIIDQYGSTKAGNLAKAYAGICYFNLGEYEKALDLLKSFSASDQMISPAIVGRIGDCYVNMGNTQEGISYFEKAAQAADNNVLSPIYLKKAGVAYESLQQYDKAVNAYKTIKEKYYGSMEASDIDKYIARASALAQ